MSDLRVLIADDSDYFRTILRSMLRGFGLRHIEEAQDGAVCLATIEQFRPHIILLDWEMPAFSGASVVEALSQNKHIDQPAILMITAHTELSRIKAAMKMPINGLLCKPISPKTLYERLAKILDSEAVQNASAAAADDQKEYVFI